MAHALLVPWHMRWYSSDMRWCTSYSEKWGAPYNFVIKIGGGDMLYLKSSFLIVNVSILLPFWRRRCHVMVGTFFATSSHTHSFASNFRGASEDSHAPRTRTIGTSPISVLSHTQMCMLLHRNAGISESQVVPAVSKASNLI